MGQSKREGVCDGSLNFRRAAQRRVMAGIAGARRACMWGGAHPR